MKKFILSVIFASFALSAFCLEAVVVSATGKAEVQSGSQWVKLEKGVSLGKGAVIQTGFKSEVVLQIKGSTVTVAPLSRITLEQLVSKDTKDETKLYLDTGSVKSNVKKADGKRVGFTVRSPVATASVRGTELTVSNGFRSTDVKTHSGSVAVWKSKNKGAELSSEAEDAAPAPEESAGSSASDIADGAPANAFTVTKGQTAGFEASGETKSAHANAVKTAVSMESGTHTAAAAESVSTAGSAAPVSAPVEVTSKPKQKGSISVNIVWED